MTARWSCAYGSHLITKSGAVVVARLTAADAFRAPQELLRSSRANTFSLSRSY